MNKNTVNEEIKKYWSGKKKLKNLKSQPTRFVFLYKSKKQSNESFLFCFCIKEKKFDINSCSKNKLVRDHKYKKTNNKMFVRIVRIVETKGSPDGIRLISTAVCGDPPLNVREALEVPIMLCFARHRRLLLSALRYMRHSPQLELLLQKKNNSP